MNQAKVGKVVKFYDDRGLMNGGGIKDFTRIENVDYAVVNTFEGETLPVKRIDLTVVDRRKPGPTSKRFLNELKEDIARENQKKTGIEAPDVRPDVYIPPSPMEYQEAAKKVSQKKIIKDLERKLEVRDKALRDLETKYNGMKEELERWKAGTMTIDSSQELLEQEKLIFTIKGLNNALFAATINKEGEMVLELTKIINHLNGIKDK